jgi:hypothetical protein
MSLNTMYKSIAKLNNHQNHCSSKTNETNATIILCILLLQNFLNEKL